MIDELEADYGPAWRSLSPMQKRFVLAMASDPLGNRTQWAKAAGYSDIAGGARVRAFEVAHNPRVMAAVQEVARGTAGTIGPMLGLAVAMTIARDSGHPKQLQAAVALMDRGGLPAQTQHTVQVHHTDNTGDALVDRIGKAAAALGLKVEDLLRIDAPKLIEGAVVDAAKDAG